MTTSPRHGRMLRCSFVIERFDARESSSTDIDGQNHVCCPSAGARVWLYRLDFAAPASPFDAAHCIELPALFGTDADWATAPIPAGADPNDVDALGRRMRATWLTFVRTGEPANETLWRQHTPATPSVYHWIPGHG